ncbi:MAG: toll/interleukin-1 receptor domain-containing protein [Xanthobacteraceae bacterium]|jgi:hypothetical protein|nr:toll/interleukin-1 receptor domain-containing protein [Xanthobacteraceae bacterium]
MAFLLPHYEYDVFVSYSHGRREASGGTPLRDWTLELINKLTTDIPTVDPEFDALNVWVDKQLDPTVHLTPELRAKVTQSAVLMVVMSPLYLVSSWCKDELEWFKHQVQDRMRDQGRVFVIRAVDSDEGRWPDFLRDERGHALPGFCFHGADDPMPYRYRDSREHNEAYVRELGRLRGALMKRLRELQANRQRSEQRTADRAAAPAGGPKTIYLHAGVEDVPVRDEVRKILVQDGIVPLTPVSDTSRDLADLTRESRVRIEMAKRCDALALLRGDSDERFIGDLIDIGFHERDRMQIARGAPLPCAVLDRSGGRSLPIDVAGHEIERFDLGGGNWRGEFLSWLDRSRAKAAAAP